MHGVVGRNPEEFDAPEFDRGFYEVKDVTGRASEPIPDAVNTISCFADNAAASDDPDLVPVDEGGTPATSDRPQFDWSYVCPTNESYREGLLEIVADCAAASPDVRLDDVGFPRAEYCRCDRCRRQFAESDHDDRVDWRASVVTEFVADAADRVPGRLHLTVYPDPYPGHLRRRSGVDLSAVTPHVDEVVAPLYDTAYGTTYWLEALASGFRDRLQAEGDPDVPLAVELYAVDVDIDDLIHATEVAEAYAPNVYFGYDASAAAAALRRMRADRRDGASHAPDGA